MNSKEIALIALLVIVVSYIIFVYRKSYRHLIPFYEHFVTSDDIMTNTSNAIMKSSDIDLSQTYQTMLKSSDLTPVESNTFELLDKITSNPNALIRKVQFDIPSHRSPYGISSSNLQSNTVENTNAYLSNTANIQQLQPPIVPPTMQEQSINQRLQTLNQNNVISIEDPIGDAYLPYSLNLYKDDVKSPEQVNHEYTVISLFKNILDRNPSKSEIEKYSRQLLNQEVDEQMLRIILINSVEYRRNSKLQSNDVHNDLEYSYARGDMISYINQLYFIELDKEIPKSMILPLKDVFAYLQNNEYLFRALLNNTNYNLFQKDVIDLKMMTKSGISELFNKYFVLYDLKIAANDIKRHDIINRTKLPKKPIESTKETPTVPVSVAPDVLQNKVKSSAIKEVNKNDDIFNKANDIFKILGTATKDNTDLLSNDIFKTQDLTNKDNKNETIPNNLFDFVNNENFKKIEDSLSTETIPNNLFDFDTTNANFKKIEDSLSKETIPNNLLDFDTTNANFKKIEDLLSKT